MTATAPGRSPAIDTLAERVARFRSFTMAHPRLIEARDEMLDAIESSAPGSLILVLGPTGVGKTTLRRKVEESLTAKLMPSLEEDPGRLPVLSVEAVAPDNGNFHWRDHFHRMLAQMREPLIEYKLNACRSGAERAANGRYTGCPRGDATGYQLQQSFENAIRYRRPAAVIIDEAQHLARMACGRKLSDQLDVIKSIASRTQTVQVLIGTYELLAFRNLSGQLSRRSVDLHFLRYRAEEQADLEIFRSIVFTFQAQLPIDSGFDLCGIWDFLYERSLGCVGVLKDWLMRAVITTLRSGGADLKQRVLEKSALSASQCEKILAEAREGELRLAENDAAQSRLRRLLNLDAGLPLPAHEESTETEIAPTRINRHKPGMRDPKRDPVGKRQEAYA
jgi:energy-coupling factor transporter ATP-binding protein EcfA2